MDTSVLNVLLVEDKPTDILLIKKMLKSNSDTQYNIHQANTISEATKILENPVLDVILLDLDLPDVKGVQAVREIRRVTTQIPIIVVTQLEDEEVAFQCIQEGVQDYLLIKRIDSVSLRLTIGYSILRNKNAEIEEFKNITENNFLLSSENEEFRQPKTQDSVKLQKPVFFEKVVKKYSDLLSSYITDFEKKDKKTLIEMEDFISNLAGQKVRSEDLLEIHLAALEKKLINEDIEIRHRLGQDGQFFVLKMMGFLANHYRKLKFNQQNSKLN